MREETKTLEDVILEMKQLADRVDSIEAIVIQKEQLEISNISCSRLTQREQDIVKQRADGKTLEEIAAQYGVTRQRISQIEAKALFKLMYVSKSRLITETIKELEIERDSYIREYKEKLKFLMPNTELPPVPPSALDLTIEFLDLSVRSYNILKHANINKVSDLVSLDYNSVLNLKHMGRKSMEEIVYKLKDYGLTLKGNEDTDNAE